MTKVARAAFLAGMVAGTDSLLTQAQAANGAVGGKVCLCGPRFDGHKSSVAEDSKSQLKKAVAVLPVNVSEARGALSLVNQSDENTGLPVTEVIADAA